MIQPHDTTPSYKLDVNGTFRTTGNATFAGNVSMSGNMDFPAEESGNPKIVFSGDIDLAISTLSQSGGGILAVGANSKINGSGTYVAIDNTKVSSMIAMGDYSSADGLHFKTGTTGNPVDRLVINHSGNATFSGALYLTRASGDAQIFLTASGTGNATVDFNNATTGGLGDIYCDNSKVMHIRTGGATEAITINASQNTTFAGTIDSGAITSTGEVTAYSDRRLKTNINTIDSALDKVTKMRGVTYDRIDGSSSSAGVLADELEKIAPELVHDGEYKSVAYGNLTSYLIEAIKELKAELDGFTK